MIGSFIQNRLIKRIDRVILSWIGIVVASVGAYFLFQYAYKFSFDDFKERIQHHISNALMEGQSAVSLKELETQLQAELELKHVSLKALGFPWSNRTDINSQSEILSRPATISKIHYYWGSAQTFIDYENAEQHFYLILIPDKNWNEYANISTGMQLILILTSSLMFLPFLTCLIRHSLHPEILKEAFDTASSKKLITTDFSQLQQHLLEITELKFKSAGFENFSERIDFALASLKIGVWEYDLQTGELIWSDEMFSIFKLDKSQFDGTYASFSNFIVPEDVQKVSEKFFTAVDNKIDFRLHFRIVHPDGEIRTMEATGLPKLNIEGEVVRVVGTNRDITIVEKNALKVEKLSRVASQTENLLVLTDCEGNIDWVNDAFCYVTGHVFESVIGQDFLSLGLVLLNEARPKVILRKVISNESTYASIWKIKKKDGQTGYYDVRCSPMFDKAYRLQGMMVAGVDVTESRKTHRLLARKQAMLEEMSYQGRIGAWEINILTGDVEVSNMYRDIFEIYDENFDLAGFMGLYENDSRDILRQAMSDCIDHDRQFRVEVDAITKNGRRLWVAITGIAEYEVLEGLNTCARLFGSVQDVSAHQDVKQALMEAKEAAENAAQIKSQFLANMSHEIRTPMNGIIGMLELMLQEHLSEQLQKYSSLALTSAKGLLTIINDILDYSKIEAGKMQLEVIDFDIEILLKNTIDSLAFIAEKKGLKCTTDFSQLHHRQYQGDPTRIRQMIVNLFGNAIKFTSAGEVGLRASSLNNGDIQITVFDTGIGIPADRIAVLFSAFTQVDSSITRHFGGSGLGLAITRNLTELMQGRIDIESEFGEGSRFIITLPLNKASLAEQIAPKENKLPQDLPTEAEEHQLKGLKVLLVDDNLVNQAVGKGVLNKLECSIAVANDGLECLELLKYQEFNVILMDCQMPVMDGFSATAAIRSGQAGEHYREIPIIALTANAMDGDRQKCLDNGMSDYLMKPLNFKMLKDKLVLWCAEPFRIPAQVWHPQEALLQIGDEKTLELRMTAFLNELDQDLTLLKHTAASGLELTAADLNLSARAKSIKIHAQELMVDGLENLATHLELAAESLNYAELPLLIEKLQLETDQLNKEFKQWQG